MLGFFYPERFSNRQTAICNEIALNPAYFLDRGCKDVMSTLVHEMVHAWQHHFGKAGRRGYHNKQWAAKMVQVGLLPTSTGIAGGKQTGQRVSHLVMHDGEFDRAYEALMQSDFNLSWFDLLPSLDLLNHLVLGAETPEEQLSILMDYYEDLGIDSSLAKEVLIEGLKCSGKTLGTRVRYQCPSCEINVWGKPLLNIVCGDCDCGLEANFENNDAKPTVVLTLSGDDY